MSARHQRRRDWRYQNSAKRLLRVGGKTRSRKSISAAALARRGRVAAKAAHGVSVFARNQQ